MSTHIRQIVLVTLFASLAGMLLLTASPANAQAAVNIPVGDRWFCDSSFEDGVCTTEISTGDTVVWDFGGASLPHTTTECGHGCDNPNDAPFWNSGTISDGSTFSFTFDEPGILLYRCNIHPNQMRGQIIVTDDMRGPVDGDDEEPSDVPPVATIEIVAGPSAGTGPGRADGGSPWLLAGLAAAGLVLLSVGGVLVTRRVS